MASEEGLFSCRFRFYDILAGILDNRFQTSFTIVMTGRIVVILLCLFAVSTSAQLVPFKKAEKAPIAAAGAQADDLIRHLAAAESHQVSGDLINAAVENRKVLGIALQRLGNIAIEEGRYADAAGILASSLKYSDNASHRTNLAIAYLRQNLFDKALSEAQAAVSLDPKHVGAHYILGNIHYSKEDYKAALPEIEFVFSSAPDFEIARALGLTYLNLKQPERARLHFEKMRVSAGKENADLHILFAKLYERTNYHDDAERELKRALAVDPGKPKVNFYLGYLLLQNGGTERMAEAGASFEKELKLNPNDFYSSFFAGVVATSQHEHQKAVGFLQKAIDLNSRNGEAYLYLAQSQIELGSLADAEKNLRRAVELESNGGKNTQSRRTHFMLGRLLLRTGKTEEGRKELAIAGKLQHESLDTSRTELSRILEAAGEKNELKPAGEIPIMASAQVKLEPERTAQLKKLNTGLVDVVAQAFNNLGVIAALNGQLKESLEEFETAASWKPDFPGLDRNLGVIAFKAGQFEKAIEPLSRHIKIDQNDELARQMLGTSYYLTKDYRKTVLTLRPIEAGLVGKPELAYFYGIALAQSELNSDAIALFSRLAAASQKDPAALAYAAHGFMLAGDYERAIKELTNVAAAAPDLPKTHFFLGQSFIRVNRFVDAENAFRRAVEIDPADESSKYQLAFTLIERKADLEEAAKLLEEAVRLRPDFAEAHYQLGKLGLEKNDFQKAILHLEAAAKADRTKEYIFYQLSIAYRRASRNADSEIALKTYQKLKAASRKAGTTAPM